MSAIALRVFSLTISSRDLNSVLSGTATSTVEKCANQAAILIYFLNVTCNYLVNKPLQTAGMLADNVRG